MFQRQQRSVVRQQILVCRREGLGHRECSWVYLLDRRLPGPRKNNNAESRPRQRCFRARLERRKLLGGDNGRAALAEWARHHAVRVDNVATPGGSAVVGNGVRKNPRRVRPFQSGISEFCPLFFNTGTPTANPGRMCTTDSRAIHARYNCGYRDRSLGLQERIDRKRPMVLTVKNNSTTAPLIPSVR